VNKTKIAALFARLKAANPAPRTELEYRSPFELLVAVILSAQATDRSVNLATRELYKQANTPQAILALGVEGLSRYIRTIGLFNTKARNIIATCAILIEQHSGKVPQSREALEALPGVGRKTANVILNVAFGHPTIAVDTHIFRVANRTGIAPGATVRAVEDQLMKRVPREYLHDAHHWMILHGRYVCLARKPKCPQCLIADLCEYPHKTPAQPTPQTPSTSARPAARPRAPRRGSLAAAIGRAAARKAPAQPAAAGEPHDDPGTPDPSAPEPANRRSDVRSSLPARRKPSRRSSSSVVFHSVWNLIGDWRE
jgi:endonuclease-3